MTRKRPEWRFIDQYDVDQYTCGLRRGDRVRLKSTFAIHDHRGIPTGEVHVAGEIWIVLAGSTADPGVVWLRQPNGDRHTWDDSPEIFDVFELISREDP